MMPKNLEKQIFIILLIKKLRTFSKAAFILQIHPKSKQPNFLDVVSLFKHIDKLRIEPIGWDHILVVSSMPFKVI